MTKIPFFNFYIISAKEVEQREKEIKQKDESLYIRSKIISDIFHRAFTKARLSGNAHRIR